MLMWRVLVTLLAFLLPWSLRRLLFVYLFGYKIHPTARIGLSLIVPQRLEMGDNARIGHFTLVKDLQRLVMEDQSIIGNLNWIAGYCVKRPRHYTAEKDRTSQLCLAKHSAITTRHLIDCTNSVFIGSFSTVAGYRSQILTHSIDLEKNIQTSQPVRIGDYCFVGSNCMLLPGSHLPSHSVLGAHGLLNKPYTRQFVLYAGVPAVPVKDLAHDLQYFTRKEGFVH